MKFTSALFLTTALLAGSALAKRPQKHHSSTTSSSSDSDSSSSSTSGSSSNSSDSSSNSSDSSSTSSSSSSTDSSADSSASKDVEDFGINGCADESAFTLVYKGFKNYDQVIEDNKKTPVTFVATRAEIRNDLGAVKSIRKNSKKQSLALSFSKAELESVFHNIKTSKKSKKISKKMAYAVKSVKESFKKRTGMKLTHVMLPTGAIENVVKAFNKNKIVVISKSYVLPKEAKEFNSSMLNGVVVVDSIKKQKDLIKLNEAIKKTGLKGISLKVCIPKGTKASFKSMETTDSEADSGVEKSAATKASDAETDTEVNAAAATEATPEKIKANDNSASSIVVSSVMSIAAIAAVAAFLL